MSSCYYNLIYENKEAEPHHVIRLLWNGSPAHTLSRKFFEVEFPITLYRVAKGAWKIRDDLVSQLLKEHVQNLPTDSSASQV